MAYDFSNIAYIKRANGTEIKQIKKGSMTLWKKPYVWEKYNVTTSSETVMGWEAYEVSSKSFEKDLLASYEGEYFYKSYTIDDDGNFVGQNGLPLTGSVAPVFFQTRPYYIDERNNILTYYAEVNPSGQWGYFDGDYYLEAEGETIKYETRWTEVSSSTTQKGTYIQNISDSTNKYPEDGISGSYWYTLISSPNIPGFNSSTSGSYSVEDVSGVTYGFVLNDNGYYESTNKDIHNSYSICKVNININKTASLYIDCINYAESGYDFGILSNLNTSLSLDYSADTTNVKKTFEDSSSSSVQTVSYGSLSAGSYYIYIKFRKDVSYSYYNDSLQFKIRIE